MICHHCKENKLSNEFPFKPLSECDCDHPVLHCLRCAVASVKNFQKCSQCGTIVKEDNKQYQHYVETLDFLFPDVGNEEEPPLDSFKSDEIGDSSSNIVVKALSGECTTIPYNPDETICNIKETIAVHLGPPRIKQRLLYKETELKTFDKDNKKALKLKDYNVPPNCTIHLIISLYEIPDGLDDVTFDLCWGYPESGRDYLDASVLLYNGSEFVKVVDYLEKDNLICSAIRHSGDKMDSSKRSGHHTIDVSIKSIPSDIDKLVFTLSAWNSPNISKYPNLSLRIFDIKFPDCQLCCDNMDSVAFSQAVIMCSLSKRDGIWQILSVKKPSSGNAKDYKPLQAEIANLIEQGYV